MTCRSPNLVSLVPNILSTLLAVQLANLHPASHTACFVLEVVSQSVTRLVVDPSLFLLLFLREKGETEGEKGNDYQLHASCLYH